MPIPVCRFGVVAKTVMLKDIAQRDRIRVDVSDGNSISSSPESTTPCILLRKRHLKDGVW
jgi:hypothetical protein